MNELAQILQAIGHGDSKVSEELMPRVCAGLRKLAAYTMAVEAAGHALQSAALVHEARLRLVRAENRSWERRAHLFSAVAEAMRRALIDRARRYWWLTGGWLRNELRR